MKHTLRFSVASLFSSVLLAGAAHAQEPAPPPPAYDEPPPAVEQPAPLEPTPVQPPPPADTAPPPGPQPINVAVPPPAPDPVPRGAERHDGFYLRIGLGVAGIRMEQDHGGSLTLGNTTYRGDVGETSVDGGGGAFELSIGGTPAKGLVLAGTLLSQQIAQPTVEYEGGETELDSALSFGLLGVTLDWYPDPTGGFHFGGTLGLAWALAENPEPSYFDYYGGVGGGVSLLVGYDWWVADEWSLGVLGRATGANVRGEADTEIPGIEGTQEGPVSSFALMFSVLHH